MIVDKVHLIEALNAQMNSAGSSAERRTFERAAEVAEKELSAIIDSLYGVEGMQVIEENESD